MPPTVRLTLRFDASLLAPKEHEFAPVLQAWDSFRGRRRMRFAPIDGLADGVVSRPFTLEFELPARGEERADDAIWFEVAALTANPSGAQVEARCGSGFVYMHELAAVAATAEPTHASTVVELAYFNYWDADEKRVKKGELHIDAVAIAPSYVVQPADKADIFQFTERNMALLQSEMQEAIRASIWPYTSAASAKGEQIDAGSPLNRRVHAPVYNGPDGWKPGYAYFINPGRRAPEWSQRNENFLLDVFGAVLARHNRSADWFVGVTSAQLARRDDKYDDRFTEACALVGEALAAPSVSLPYIGDEVDTASRVRTNAHGSVSWSESSVHGVESFDWAQLRRGGDCDDVGRLIYSTYTSFRDGAWRHPTLKAVQALLRCYTAAGVLSSVLGAQLSDERHRKQPFVVGTKRDSEVEIGAHIYTQLIPEHKFLALVKRVNRDLDVATLRGKGAPTAPWREAMPHLILEGTGRLHPLQRPRLSYVTSSDSAVRERFVARERALAALVRFIAQNAVAPYNGAMMSLQSVVQVQRHQRQTERIANARLGFFYRDPTHLMTDEFLQRGFPVADFTVVNVGAPQLVPADAAADYSDDPMLAPTFAPSLGAVAAAEEATEWELMANSISQAPDDSDSFADSSVALAPPPASVGWRTPALSAHALLTAKDASGGTGTDRFDRFDYASSAKRTLTYGVPTTSLLEDRPMLNHVALLPGVPLDEIKARVLATHMRHGKPVQLAADMSAAHAMYEARRASLRFCGADVDGIDAAEARNLEHLRAQFRARVSRRWPAETSFSDGLFAEGDGLVNVNLYFSRAYLRTRAIAEFIVEALAALGKSGVVQYGRVRTEQFVPGAGSVVLQLLCTEPPSAQ